MRTRVITAVALLSTCLADRVAGEVARPDEPVVISEGRRLPSPIFVHAAASSYEIGVPCALSLCLTNRPSISPTVHIPLKPMINGEPLMSIKVMNEDGAEAATYPDARVALFDVDDHDPPQHLAVLTIPPGQQLDCVSPQFIPWEPGQYTYRLEIKNQVTKKRVLSFPKGIGRLDDVPIPNVWVGRLVLEGRLSVEQGPSEDLKKTLDRLQAQVLDSGRPLPVRTSALDSLVEMRHVYATDTLMTIEGKKREERETRPFICWSSRQSTTLPTMEPATGRCACSRTLHKTMM